MSTTMKSSLLAGVFALAIMAIASTAFAAPKDCDEDATTVPGHCGKESGVVIGNYYSVYAYDNNGDWYWDLGDGRVQGSVAGIDELDAETLTQCDYRVHYKGDFGDDPYLDDGVIQNMINCKGYDDNGTYNYIIVNETDPRYTGNPEWAIWGNWEYHVLTESGSGNLVRPSHAI